MRRIEFQSSLLIAVAAALPCILAQTTGSGFYGSVTMRYPTGTRATASFATDTDKGAENLIDGNPDTWMIGAAGTVTSPTNPVWVDITFGTLVHNLLGVITGKSDQYFNYYPKQAEFWVDTAGNGEFEMLGVKATLGGGGAAAGTRLFTTPARRAFGLRFLVTEQNMAGINRCFTMNELTLVVARPDEPTAAVVTRSVNVPEAGDRKIPMHIVYPPGAFRENGGPVINIKHAPFHAAGDGVTDDTEAFLNVLDFIAAEQAAKRTNWFIYMPAGTYLVSDSLAARQDAGPEGFCYLRLIGQNRANTIIRLKDHAPGFGDSSRPKTLLPWEGRKPGQGNILWGNLARNFTIDIGKGNPGAIAMTFMGANASSIDNITIRSGDGRGRIGLHFSWWAVQGHYCDITVEGFDVGICGVDTRETQPTLEYVTLTDQRVAGYQTGPHAASIRRLRFCGSAPALVLDHPGAHVVLLDSRLEGQTGAMSAIVSKGIKGAQLFARNVVVTGYSTAIEEYGTAVHKGNIVEYVSGPLIRTRHSSPLQSLAMPVEEVQLAPWESNPAHWTSPEDYQGTVVERVQKALNSGKPAIYFPKNYDVTDRVTVFNVPATVKQMDFLSVQTRWWCTFEITQASETPLWIENAAIMPTFALKAQRAVHFRNGRFGWKVLTDKPVTIHMQNGCALSHAHSPEACPPNARIFARSINEEVWNDNALEPNFRINGGIMWVLGFKTEQRQPSFLVENGGILEVLGGYQNQTADINTVFIYPMIINYAHASVAATTHMCRKYPFAIWEKRDQYNVEVNNDELPRRVGFCSPDYTIPLYTGYGPQALERVRGNAGETYRRIEAEPHDKGIRVLSARQAIRVVMPSSRAAAPVSLMLVNMAGRTVWTSAVTASETLIDVSDISPGMHLLRVKGTGISGTHMAAIMQ